jgi:hypothetical protein
MIVRQFNDNNYLIFALSVLYAFSGGTLNVRL